MAQSTNDVIPTAMRLATLATLPGPAAGAGAAGPLAARQGRGLRRHHQVGPHPSPGRDARSGSDRSSPPTAARSQRHREKLAQAADWLREMNIGGTAVGTGINAEPEYPGLMVKHLQQVSGLELREGQDRIQLMQSMGDIATFSGALRAYVLDLNKIANDIRLLASGPRTGLAEIVLPAVQPGSSIMPGKVNPVDRRDGEPGLLPGARARSDRGDGGGGGAARAQRHDAGDHPQHRLRADHRREREPGARRAVRGRDRGGRGAVRLLAGAESRRWSRRSRPRSAMPRRPSWPRRRWRPGSR